MALVDILGSYAYRTSYDDLPEAVIAGAKTKILDLLGVAFLGYKRGFHKPMFDVLQSFGGNNESTVIGEGVKLPCSHAALINSSLVADLADGDRHSQTHPSVSIIPAALAAAEAQARNRAIGGKDLILAVALGYEVMIRIARGINPSARARGYHVTALTGPIGAATAAAKIMNLPEESIIDSIAIASVTGSGLQEAFKAPERNFVQLVYGRSSGEGVLAALLARAGLKGSNMILEDGFLPAVSDEPNVEPITRDLGQEYMLPQTYLKRHAGFAPAHPPIDAALRIIEKHNIDLSAIEQIGIKMGRDPSSTAMSDPRTVMHAKLNVPYCVALALVYGDATEDSFTEQNLNNVDILRLMKRVKMQPSPELDREYPAKRTATVAVTTKDGQTFRQTVAFAKGQPEYPLSRFDLVKKFQSLTAGVVSVEAKRQIIDFLDNLEAKEDLTGLFSYLKASA